jgi:hypothetical protein
LHNLCVKFGEKKELLCPFSVRAPIILKVETWYISQSSTKTFKTSYCSRNLPLNIRGLFGPSRYRNLVGDLSSNIQFYFSNYMLMT